MQQLETGSPQASAAIWDWRAGPNAQKTAASDGAVRLRGVLQGVAGGVVGGALWALGWHGVATAAFVVGGIVMTCALISPRGLYAAIQRLFEATGHAVGVGLSWLLLVPFFYLFFAPFGALFRRGRRDRLQRRYDSNVATYWEPHEGMLASSGRIDRQY